MLIADSFRQGASQPSFEDMPDDQLIEWARKGVTEAGRIWAERRHGERKALRHVRTPEGVEVFDLPIGAPIRKRVDREVQRALDDQSLAQQNPAKVDRASGVTYTSGMIATTRSFVTPDGTKGISKAMSDNSASPLPAQHQADAEYLTSLVARAVGALTPSVFQVDVDDPDQQGDAEIWMTFVDGETPDDDDPDRGSLMQRYRHARYRDGFIVWDSLKNEPAEVGEDGEPISYDITEALKHTRLVQYKERLRRASQLTDYEMLLGLLDILVFNIDRNLNNWMVTPEGSTVGIDHGHAFANMERGTLIPTYSNIEGTWFPGVVGWFAEPYFEPLDDDKAMLQNIVQRESDRKLAASIDISPGDMDLIERALDSLKDEFAAAGRLPWWKDMMQRFDMIRTRAHGTRDRLSDPEAQQ